MREIKFRAWDELNQYMYYDIQKGTPFEDEKGRRTIGASFQRYLDASNLTIMQFTGLHDKNGKDIYEDDYVLCEGKLHDEEKTTIRIGKMIFAQHSYQLVLINKDKEWEYPCSISYVPNKLEVIGNIYENSNLLEVQ